jgi:hypothetical protein
MDCRTGLNDENRKFLTLPRMELRPLGRPARSQSPIPTESVPDWVWSVVIRNVKVLAASIIRVEEISCPDNERRKRMVNIYPTRRRFKLKDDNLYLPLHEYLKSDIRTYVININSLVDVMQWSLVERYQSFLRNLVLSLNLRQEFPMRLWQRSTTLHGVTSHKAVILTLSYF